MPRENKLEEYVPIVQAVARLRTLARGRRVFLHCAQHAQAIPLRHAAEVSACVHVSVESAANYIRTAYGADYRATQPGYMVCFAYEDMQRPGASRCLFIGGA